MTKAAIVRRQCKRAMRQLILQFGYKAEAFEVPENTDNSMDVLPGTPIYWTPPSYYDNESDCCLAVDEYAQMKFVHETDWDAMYRWDSVREKYRGTAALEEK